MSRSNIVCVPWLLSVCATLPLLAACSAQSRLEAGGATPYVRCLQGPAPDARTLTVGARTFALKDRTLRVSGGSGPVRVAVTSGPGLGPALSAAERAVLARSAADLAIVLGGLGHDAPTASASLAQLAELPMPVVFIAGGRDRFPVLEAAFSAADDKPRIIDGTALRQIRIGRHTLIPLAGAEGGRYAVDAAGCGFGGPDLEALVDELGAKTSDEQRTLVSWHAPAAGKVVGVTRTGRGKDTGSFTLARLVDRTGTSVSLAAWPAVQAVRPALDDRGMLEKLVVPRLWGPRLERDDRSRPEPGYALVSLDAAGLRLLR